MAKLILKDALTHYITSLKTDLTHCALMSSGNAGSVLGSEMLALDSSDKVGTVKTLNVQSTNKKFHVISESHPTDKSKILNFETHQGVSFNRLVLLKPISSSADYDINGVITFPGINPQVPGSYMISSFEITISGSEEV